MRVLLTGSSGFLGRHILASPAAAGVKFVRATRASEARSEDEVALGSRPWGQAEFERALAVSRAEVVLHCAGATHGKEPGLLFKANTLPAASLLAAVSKMADPPRVILIGSAAEYGFVDPDALPVGEDHPCQPRSEYGIAKYAQTLLGLAAAERGMPVLTARLFNPVGLGMPPGLALPSFARRIAAAPDRDGVISVGDMEARRDFIDVAEAARILLALARAPYWPWPVVNLCSGKAFNLGALLDSMIAVSGLKLQVMIDPNLSRPGDMRMLVGSTERLSKLHVAPAAPDFDRLIPQLLAEAHKLGQR
jgi:GDP-4-dehydro-6-deoxy-D-mannose reductase